MKTRNKLKILDQAPITSREEIESYMDFDAVLNEYGKVKTTFGSQILKGALLFVGITLLGIASYYFIENNKDKTTSKADKSSLKVATQIEEQDQPTIEPTQELTDNQPKSKKLIATKETKKEEEANRVEIKKDRAKEKNTSSNVEEEKKVVQETSYTYIEATPVEGLTYLYAYFHENLKYPEELRKDSIEGVVLISFSILKDSTVNNIKIVQSLGEKFDNEAMRVVKNMPKWIPATVNNTPVSSKLSIPLTFNIEK